MNSRHTPFIKLNPIDNVVVSITSLGLGARVEGIDVLDNIAPGHKIAIESIAEGAQITKYGQVIGFAKHAISAGQHVHDHNIEFRQSRPEHMIGKGIKDITSVPEPDRQQFMGFNRGNDQYGTRNFIAILTSVNCSATAAHNIARAFDNNTLSAFKNVDGVASFTHSTGCGMDKSGDGYANLQRVLWGYASHPNCGGVLMVGLGCETNQIDEILERYQLKDNARFRSMNIQDQGGLRKTIEHGTSIVQEMLSEIDKNQREPCPISGLTLGLQCGGSDAWSGITANPALGYASDLLIRGGGTAVLAETPEIYGAEHLLTRRARSEKVAQELMDRISWWEDYTSRNFGSMDNNPSHGNKRGGLSTILEKSLGAVAKSGTLPMEAVYRYGEPIKHKGFVMMDSPGYDPASITGQIASGCNIVAFTTGRGSVYGSKPAPSIKIATNTPMFSRMQEDMDINAGLILDGEASIAEIGENILNLLIDVASGKPSLSESQGLGDHEFIPWQIGAVM
ncbi:MAG: altronate hydrolase [Parasphingorhabdus sp.]|jgi:altronate hydrolase